MTTYMYDINFEFDWKDVDDDLSVKIERDIADIVDHSTKELSVQLKYPHVVKPVTVYQFQSADVGGIYVGGICGLWRPHGNSKYSADVIIIRRTPPSFYVELRPSVDNHWLLSMDLISPLTATHLARIHLSSGSTCHELRSMIKTVLRKEEIHVTVNLDGEQKVIDSGIDLFSSPLINFAVIGLALFQILAHNSKACNC